MFEHFYNTKEKRNKYIYYERQDTKLDTLTSIYKYMDFGSSAV